MALGADALPFVAALAKDATDFATLAVFADWLEEHGHTDLRVRFRRLMPQTGDLLVYWFHGYDYAEHLQLRRVRDVANSVRQMLRDNFGVDTCWLVLPEGHSVQHMDEATMRELGWVRAPQQGVPEE
jgi:uncharacterized protein (TIGR02996 family)